ncbi:hypothetical protein DIPPA_55270 [Diplonema papillatum]|nr:hypothetical protein DIPPA_55270 [Diplonema papillatum]
MPRGQRQCPLCWKLFDASQIEVHADQCPGVVEDGKQPTMLSPSLSRSPPSARAKRGTRKRKSDVAVISLSPERLSQPDAFSCTSCRSRLGNDSVYGSDCGHFLCATCARQSIEQAATQETAMAHTIPCPSCPCNSSAVLPTVDVRRLALDTTLKTLDRHETHSSTHLVKCPQCPFTFEPALPPQPAKKPSPPAKKGRKKKQKVAPPGPDVVINGKSISSTAAAHRETYRHRCPACSAEFCSTCGLTPYHLGYTCEGYVDHKSRPLCRYCDMDLPKKRSKNAVQPTHCKQADCVSRSKRQCSATLVCGHPCNGCDGEATHLACMKEDCASANPAKPSEDELCNVCYVEELKAAPCVSLKCGHVFHFHCLEKKISRKWVTDYISFSFLNCPLCNALMESDVLTALMQPHLDYQANVVRLRRERMTAEGIETEQKAARVMSYYPCFKCGVPYYGGRRECNANNDQELEGKVQKEDMVCPSCSQGAGVESCPTHGTTYIEHKCRYCCSVASFFCWGTTHFCAICHETRRSATKACGGKRVCPLGVDHPPHGTEYPLGCGLCRAHSRDSAV